MAGIAFTYNPTTPTGWVRMLAGDTNPEALNRTGGDRTRTDEEIGLLLQENDQNPRAAAAELLLIRAAEYAREAYLLEQGALRQDLRQRSEQCLKASQALQKRAGESALTSDREAKFTGADFW